MGMSKPQYTTLLAIVLFSLVVIGIFIGKWLTEADCKAATLRAGEEVAEVISIGNDINAPLNLTEEQAKGQKWDLGTYPPNPQKTASIHEACVFLANSAKFWMNVADTYHHKTYASMRASLLAANHLRLYELCGCGQYGDLMLHIALELKALEEERLGRRK